MLTKVLQSALLIAATLAGMIIAGLLAYILLWSALFALFAYSRLSGGAVIFSGWSWSRFLVTLGTGLSIAYGLLLLTAGF